MPTVGNRDGQRTSGRRQVTGRQRSPERRGQSLRAQLVHGPRVTRCPQRCGSRVKGEPHSHRVLGGEVRVEPCRAVAGPGAHVRLGASTLGALLHGSRVDALDRAAHGSTEPARAVAPPSAQDGLLDLLAPGIVQASGLVDHGERPRDVDATGRQRTPGGGKALAQADGRPHVLLTGAHSERHRRSDLVGCVWSYERTVGVDRGRRRDGLVRVLGAARQLAPGRVLHRLRPGAQPCPAGTDAEQLGVGQVDGIEGSEVGGEEHRIHRAVSAHRDAGEPWHVAKPADVDAHVDRARGAALRRRDLVDEHVLIVPES